MKFDKHVFRRIIIIVIIGIVVFCALQNLDSIGDAIKRIGQLFLPFFLGAAIAFIFNVPMRYIERALFKKRAAKVKPEHKKKFKNFRRTIAYLITLGIIAGIIILIICVVVPEIVETVELLATQIPLAIAETEAFVNDLNREIPYLEEWLAEAGITWTSITEKITGLLSDAPSMLISGGIELISSVAGAVFNGVIAFAFSIYMLAQKENLKRQGGMALRALFPKKLANEMIRILKLSHKTFANFLSGQCLEACILGIICLVAMSILRLPLAMMASVIVGVCSLIPIFGAFIGCAIGMVLIAIINPIQALIFLIMIIVIQQIEGNLIYPHVVGTAIGLPSIWVLLAVTLGAKMFGVVGMIVFIPLCSVIYALFREFVYKRLKADKSAVEVVREKAKAD